MLEQDLQVFDRPENTTGALNSRADLYLRAVFSLMGFNVALILIAPLGVSSRYVVALTHGRRLGVGFVFAGLPPVPRSGYIRIRVESVIDKNISGRFSKSALNPS